MTEEEETVFKADLGVHPNADLVDEIVVLVAEIEDSAAEIATDLQCDADPHHVEVLHVEAVGVDHAAQDVHHLQGGGHLDVPDHHEVDLQEDHPHASRLLEVVEAEDIRPLHPRPHLQVNVFFSCDQVQ